MTLTNTDVVIELEKKNGTQRIQPGMVAERCQNDIGIKSDDAKFDLMETANSSDGYMQIHDQCFTYLVNLAKTKMVVYFMPM